MYANNATGRQRSMLSRRRVLQGVAWTSGMVASGVGSWLLPAPWASAADPIKVGIATDLTGPIGYFEGIGYANVATMVTDDINAKGGLLGRPLELYIEDTASEERIGVKQRAQADRAAPRRRGAGRRHQLHAQCDQGRHRHRGPHALRLSYAVRRDRVHALPLLHRVHAGAAMRPVHAVADRQRRQALRLSRRRLRLAQEAERVRAPGDRAQWRRGYLRGVLSV